MINLNNLDNLSEALISSNLEETLNMKKVKNNEWKYVPRVFNF
jgi:hypothetical protein